MTEETYQEMVDRQTVLYQLEDPAKEQQTEQLQRAYDQLLKDHHNERMKKDSEILYLGKKNEELLKQINERDVDNLGLIKLNQTLKTQLKSITGRLSWSQVRNMFLFEEYPEYIYFNITGDGELLWLKSPYEFKQWEESLKSE